MIHPREVLPPPLEHALLASRVLAGLEQLGLHPAPPTVDAALRDAVSFLEAIRKGEAYTRQREISERSYECALAYGEAIQAIEKLPRPTPPREASEIIQALEAVAKNLRDHKTADPDELDCLKTFFKLVRELTIAAEPRPIERITIDA